MTKESKELSLPTTSSAPYITLPKADIEKIDSIIVQTQSVGPLSATQLLKTLEFKGIASPEFLGLREFLGYVEGVRYVTYKDSVEVMTIGIGLNIQYPERNNAQALFYNINTALGDEFPKMQKQEGLPQPPLTSSEVDKLLYLSLIGATYKDATGKIIQFEGYIKRLIAALHAHGLADVPFKYYQLIALQSLVFNAPALVGKNLCEALTEMIEGDPYGELNVLIEITECSNRHDDIGLSNRRLKEAALFHGNSANVHLSWREYTRLIAHKETAPPATLPKYGLPMGQNQDDYVGKEVVTIDPGRDHPTTSNNTIYFGSRSQDRIATVDEGSKVLLGGDGDNFLTISDSEATYTYESRTHYLAGNRGYDLYNLTLYVPYMVYDSDRWGKITSFNPYLPSADYSIQGIALPKPDAPNQYNLGCVSTYVSFTLQPNAHSYTPDNWFNSSSSYPKLIIPNFVSGQFGIVTSAMNTVVRFPYEYSQYTTGLLIQNGNSILVTQTSTNITACIITPTGVTAEKVNVVSFDSVTQSNGMAPEVLQFKNKNILVCVPLRINRTAHVVGNIYTEDGDFITKFQTEFPKDSNFPANDTSKYNMYQSKTSILTDDSVAVVYDASLNWNTTILGQVFSASGKQITNGFYVRPFEYMQKQETLKAAALNDGTFVVSELINGTATGYILDQSGNIKSQFVIVEMAKSVETLTAINDGFHVTYTIDSSYDLFAKRYNIKQRTWTAIAKIELSNADNCQSLALKNDSVVIFCGNSCVTGIIVDPWDQALGRETQLPKVSHEEYICQNNLLSLTQTADGDSMVLTMDSPYNTGQDNFLNLFQLGTAGFIPPPSNSAASKKSKAAGHVSKNTVHTSSAVHPVPFLSFRTIINGIRLISSMFLGNEPSISARVAEGNSESKPLPAAFKEKHSLEESLEHPSHISEPLTEKANDSVIEPFSEVEAAPLRLLPTDSKSSLPLNEADPRDAKLMCISGTLEVNGQPASLCVGGNYAMYVFPKSSPNTGLVPSGGQVAPPLSTDHYDPSSCRPVNFYGRPSVFCEGDKTTLIYAPQISAPPFAYLDGNLMLGHVALHMVGKTFSWIQSSISNWWHSSPPPSLPTRVIKTELQTRMQKLDEQLIELQHQLEALPTSKRWLRFAVDEHYDQLQDMKENGYATTDVLDELEQNIRESQREVEEEFHLQQSAEKPDHKKATGLDVGFFASPTPLVVDSGQGALPLNSPQLEVQGAMSFKALK